MAIKLLFSRNYGGPATWAVKLTGQCARSGHLDGLCKELYITQIFRSKYEYFEFPLQVVYVRGQLHMIYPYQVPLGHFTSTGTWVLNDRISDPHPFHALRIQGLKYLPMRIRIQGVKYVRIRIRGLIYYQKFSVFFR